MFLTNITNWVGLTINLLHPRADTPPTWRAMPANTGNLPENGPFTDLHPIYADNAPGLGAGDR